LNDLPSEQHIVKIKKSTGTEKLSRNGLHEDYLATSWTFLNISISQVLA
jgi:hypothetical protein